MGLRPARAARARGRAAGWLLAGALVGLAAPAPASPLRLFGFGGRSPGAAGTGAATADDYEACYLNPAGLARARKRVALGGAAGAFDLRIDGRRVDTDLAHGTVIGLAVPLAFGGALRGRAGIALGLYIPNATLNKAKAPFPGEPAFAILETSAHVVAIQLAAGVRVTGRLAIGAGTRVLAALRGDIHVVGDASGRISTQSEQRLITHFAPVAGVQYRQRDDLRWGVAVTGVSRSDYDIGVRSDLGDALPVQLPQLRIAGTPQYDPITAVAEVAWQLAPRWTLSAQLGYERWSAAPLPTEDPLVGQPPAQPPPGFHDIVVPKLAVERTGRSRRTEWAARGGYAFVPSPAPEMTGRQSLLDNHRHVVAAGLGAAWPAAAVPLRVDAWLQLHVLQPRRHTKDAAAFGADDPPPFDTIDTGGRVVAAGIVVGVDL